MGSTAKNVIQIIVAAAVGGLAVYFFAQPQPQKVSAPLPSPGAPAAEHVFLNAADLTWVDAPASLPKGAKLVVLEGDPAKAGPFTMRLQLPPNYKVAPHFHPAIEHVTVLSGAFYLGQGSEFSEVDLKSLPIGGFAVMPQGMRHFARTKDAGAVLQLHGVGPWGLTYVNQVDDPRQANK